MIYIYAAQEMRMAHYKIYTPESFDPIIKKYKTVSHEKLLNETFVATQEDNLFAKSGFVQHKLICSYIWIRK